MLVSMPFAAVERPSLALGLLSALLQRAGINVVTRYANLLFLDTLKDEDWLFVEKMPPENAFGDWIFSGTVFPTTNDHTDDYIEALIENVSILKNREIDHFRQRLLKMRNAGALFVEAFAEQVVSERPRILACTSTFQQHLASLGLCRAVKAQVPDIITLMGGANCETVMGKVTHENFGYIDYVVSGEADDLITPLIQAILEYGIAIPKDRVPSGVFVPAHRNSGYPQKRKEKAGDDGYPRAKAKHLNDLPVPDYDAYFATLDAMPAMKTTIVPCLPMESSRGCFWGKCRFCGLNGHQEGQRAKSTEKVLTEMDMLIRRHEVDRIDMVDNVLPAQHLPELFQQLTSRPEKPRIFYEVRASLTRNEIELLHNAGVNWVQPGIESLNTRILSQMNKGSAAWQNIQFLKWAGYYGIRCVWKIMFGFPGEKDQWYEQMARIIPFLTHLEPPDAINQVRFDRYSVYHRKPEAFDLSLRPFKTYSLAYPLPLADLESQTYFFEENSRSRRESSLLLSNLIGVRSLEGLHMVRIALREWRKYFWNDKYERPTLTIEHKHPFIRIRDTRPATESQSIELDKLQSSIFMDCDAAQKIDTLKKAYVAAGVPEDDFDTAIARMVDLKILLHIDNRLLSLAFDHGKQPLADTADCPLGYFDPEKEPKQDVEDKKTATDLIDDPSCLA